MDKLDPRMDQRLDKVDEVLTRQIKNVTVAAIVYITARNLSQAVAMSITDVSRRLVDLKLPMKWI